MVVDSDGAVWFTDPGYGIVMSYEGELAEAELPTRVYRLDPVTGDAAVVADDLVKPNGRVLFPGRVAALHLRYRELPRSRWTGAHSSFRGG